MPTNVTELYRKVLIHLSTEQKLDLIIKLVESIKKEVANDKPAEKPEKPDLRTCFQGDWSDIEIDRWSYRDEEEEK